MCWIAWGLHSACQDFCTESHERLYRSRRASGDTGGVDGSVLRTGVDRIIFLQNSIVMLCLIIRTAKGEEGRGRRMMMLGEVVIVMVMIALWFRVEIGRDSAKVLQNFVPQCQE